MDKKSAFFLLISLLILAAMIYLVGVNEVINALKIANLVYIGVAVAIQVSVFYLYSLRWQILNGLADMNVSIKKLIPMTLVGLAVNNITPSGRGGGEPVRAYILSREGGFPMEETFATVVADRALDTIPFALLAIITIVGMTFFFDFDLWLLLVMIIAVVLIVVALSLIIMMSVNPDFGKRVDGWIIRLVRKFYKKNSDELEEKIHGVVFGFQDTMKLLISNKIVLYYALPLSFLIWILEIFRVYFVFLAFGAVISPIIIGEVFIVASLVGMIPLLPGGLGVVDGMMVVFYSAAGISPSLSAAATVIERLISFWMATILGMVILPHYGSSVLDKISFGSSSKEIEEAIDDSEDK